MQNLTTLKNGGNIDSGEEHFEPGGNEKNAVLINQYTPKIKVKRLHGATFAAQVERLSINGILSWA